MSKFKIQMPNGNELVGFISLVGFIDEKWKVEMAKAKDSLRLEV